MNKDNPDPETILLIANALREAKPPKGATTRIIAIDGLAGSGKTTLANKLSKELGGAQIVHTDDFAAWDNFMDWWPRLIEQVLLPLSKEETSQYQRYDWIAQRLDDWITISPDAYIIIEGVTSSRMLFKPYLTYSVWIEAPKKLRLKRGLKRDGQDAADFWEKWMNAETEFMETENPKSTADFILDGSQLDLPRI